MNWIDVKDRLPNRGDEVLATCGKYMVVVMFNQYNEFMELSTRLDYTSNITHWMPLPEPPKD